MRGLAAQPQPATAAEPTSPFVLSSGRATLTLTGYVEALYQWNFNTPVNGVTAWRGFDNRHNTFTLSNVVLGASWSYRALTGRLALQVGHTPETYYQPEPARRALPGAGATGPEVWKYVQEALLGVRAGAWLVEAGLFLSPIGPESMAVRDNWNWSRSNLFYGLPYYHTGLRVTYAVSPRHALTLGLVNGWNSVVDNNAAKSVMLQYVFTPSDRASLSALYFGGIERDEAEATGAYWRNTFDLYGRVRVGRRVTLMGHLNVGWEPNRLGDNAWFAFALYGRVELTRTLRAALRFDYFLDSAPTPGTRIFWPVDWMTSQTVTLDFAPFDHLLVRAEYRHDIAEAAAFYEGRTLTTGVPGIDFNTRTQDTLTLGVVAGF